MGKLTYKDFYDSDRLEVIDISTTDEDEICKIIGCEPDDRRYIKLMGVLSVISTSKKYMTNTSPRNIIQKYYEQDIIKNSKALISALKNNEDYGNKIDFYLFLEQASHPKLASFSADTEDIIALLEVLVECAQIAKDKIDVPGKKNHMLIARELYPMCESFNFKNKKEQFTELLAVCLRVLGFDEPKDLSRAYENARREHQGDKKD